MPALPPSPRAPVPPAALQARALVVLCMLNHTALSGSRVAVSLSALALGGSAFQVGLLIATFSLLPTLGSVALGRWVDHHGTRLPALAGMAAMSAGLLLPLVQLTPAALWLTAALVGGGYSAALLALQSQLGRLPDPARRARGFSGFALGTALSGSLGPLVAGQCLSLAGAPATFAVLAGIGLAAAAGLVLGRSGLAGQGHAASGTPQSRLPLRRLLQQPLLRRIVLLDLLMAVAWNANSFMVPLHGTQQGWPAASVGQLLALFGAAVMLVRTVPASWRQRLGDWQAIRIALASSALCFLLFPWADRFAVALLLEFVLGLGLGGALPSVLGLLHTHAPPGHDGEVLGLRLVVLNVSAIALPIGLGGLGAALGLTRVMVALGAALSLGAARPPPRQGPVDRSTRPPRWRSISGARCRPGSGRVVTGFDKEGPAR
ncbi:MFS transporter [Eleftheria terrae]|uniref:MFS transporter n=1 Tax=Eleftheria terrae TaxID=1597781 RepID=UPI00263B2C62|nr:MFS transporter [Eleftheria terrae]WKB55298.1 MFS transporter [Eleftheria terrae]